MKTSVNVIAKLVKEKDFTISQTSIKKRPEKHRIK